MEEVAKKEAGRELVWRGRQHIGDDPGIYGDATYCGLSVQLPLQLLPFPQASDGKVVVVVEAEEVLVHAPSEGHPVVVYGHGPDSAAPNQWRVWEIGRDLLKTGELSRARITIDPPAPQYVSVLVSVDGTIPAGLYDDFVVTRMSISSTSYFAAFGFRPA